MSRRHNGYWILSYDQVTIETQSVSILTIHWIRKNVRAWETGCNLLRTVLISKIKSLVWGLDEDYQRRKFWAKS